MINKFLSQFTESQIVVGMLIWFLLGLIFFIGKRKITVRDKNERDKKMATFFIALIPLLFIAIAITFYDKI